MNQPDTSFVVAELTHYSDQDAVDIGALLPHLSDKFDGQTIPKELLANIVSSPFHAQFVVRSNDKVIGIATVSVILGAGSGHSAWLEDFVVSPQARGTGAASALWDAMIDWCEEKQVKSLNFTSRSSRKAAHRFYEKHGAAIRDTSVFKKSINLSS